MRIRIRLVDLLRCLVALYILTPVVVLIFFRETVRHSGRFDHWTLAEVVVAFYALLAVVIGSSIGLLFFNWWARLVFTVVVVASWVDTIVSLDQSSTPSAEYREGAEAIIEIGLLALIWVSPLKTRFRKPVKSIDGEHSPAPKYRDRIHGWRHGGKIALASACSAVVAVSCNLPPTVGVFYAKLVAQPDSAQNLGNFETKFTVFSLATHQALHFAAPWILISFVVFPLVRFGLTLPITWSRWTSAAMGVSAPLLFLLAAETMSPQFKVPEFFITPICSGIPAALVFGEIVGYGRSSMASRGSHRFGIGRALAMGFSALCVLGLAAIAQQTWSIGAQAFPLKAEWQYRLRHPSW